MNQIVLKQSAEILDSGEQKKCRFKLTRCQTVVHYDPGYLYEKVQIPMDASASYSMYLSLESDADDREGFEAYLMLLGSEPAE